MIHLYKIQYEHNNRKFSHRMQSESLEKVLRFSNIVFEGTVTEVRKLVYINPKDTDNKIYPKTNNLYLKLISQGSVKDIKIPALKSNFTVKDENEMLEFVSKKFKVNNYKPEKINFKY